MINVEVRNKLSMEANAGGLSLVEQPRMLAVTEDVIILTPPPPLPVLLLETGGALLLESGFKLSLE
jgi:hypothetical protein